MEQKIFKAVHTIILMLAGLGCLKVAELTGHVNIHIDSMDISPAQASIIRNDLDYDTETIMPRPRKNGIKNK